MVHDGGAYLVTLYMINCNVIISMLHYHVPYMKDLPVRTLNLLCITVVSMKLGKQLFTS